MLPRFVEIKPVTKFAKDRLGGSETRMAEVLHGPCEVACFPDGKGIYIKFHHNGHTRWIPEFGDKHWLILRTINIPEPIQVRDDGSVVCDNSAFFSSFHSRQMS